MGKTSVVSLGMKEMGARTTAWSSKFQTESGDFPVGGGGCGLAPGKLLMECILMCHGRQWGRAQVPSQRSCGGMRPSVKLQLRLPFVAYSHVMFLTRHKPTPLKKKSSAITCGDREPWRGKRINALLD
jgi:hypothetical protein